MFEIVWFATAVFFGGDIINTELNVKEQLKDNQKVKRIYKKLERLEKSEARVNERIAYWPETINEFDVKRKERKNAKKRDKYHLQLKHVKAKHNLNTYLNQ